MSEVTASEEECKSYGFGECAEPGHLYDARQRIKSEGYNGGGKTDQKKRN
jgi:hypothetical protein